MTRTSSAASGRPLVIEPPRKERATPRLTIFVYGTLKRGGSNHRRFCRDALEVREGIVRGRMYDLPFGFPAIVVPEETVLAVGTADYAADALRSGRPAKASDIAPGPVVFGEVMTFDDPEERLPSIDGLEGYRPGEKGLYRRVLVPVELPGEAARVVAWAYSIGSASGIHLPGGRWHAG